MHPNASSQDIILFKKTTIEKYFDINEKYIALSRIDSSSTHFSRVVGAAAKACFVFKLLLLLSNIYLSDNRVIFGISLLYASLHRIRFI